MFTKPSQSNLLHGVKVKVNYVNKGFRISEKNKVITRPGVADVVLEASLSVIDLAELSF